jgi:hypothetical protein
MKSATYCGALPILILNSFDNRNKALFGNNMASNPRSISHLSKNSDTLSSLSPWKSMPDEAPKLNIIDFYENICNTLRGITDRISLILFPDSIAFEEIMNNLCSVPALQY